MLAFGDAQNDETMFDAVGFAVVMGNARDSVKQKASFITKSHEEDGVVYALETLGLLPRGG
jgi:hydroxymethylpyrimidine pyrophosphatase-like HAD family hydrolase